jgi:hypothetical protein
MRVWTHDQYSPTSRTSSPSEAKVPDTPAFVNALDVCVTFHEARLDDGVNMSRRDSRESCRFQTALRILSLTDMSPFRRAGEHDSGADWSKGHVLIFSLSVLTSLVALIMNTSSYLLRIALHRMNTL